MALEIVAASSAPQDAEVIAVPYFVEAVAASTAGPSIDAEVLARRGFEGKAGQAVNLDADGKLALVVGLGDRGELTLDSLRRYGASVARNVSKSAVAAVLLPESPFTNAETTQAITEGALLGAYRFNAYKSDAEDPKLNKIVVVEGDTSGVELGATIAGAVSLARDLINHPAITMTPTRLGEIATDVAAQAGLEIEVWDEATIERERLGGLRGVSMGSDQPPRLIKLTYAPDSPTATLALVGKGITFDSGGLSIKPADGMMTMKTDMSGAAAVVAVMSVLPKLAPDVKVVAYACVTENLPGPKAVKPGDVLRARNGKTMEVLNTDAEGRLVLADGLSLAAETDADAVIDIATLTGACVVALGNEIGGLMGNNDALRTQVQEASVRAGEDLWHLPLPKKYRKHIDSEIADIKNIGAGKGAAGTLSAGLFLQEFVGDKPWVHLDIAGPARAEGDDGYIVKGATGFSVRTLIEVVRSFHSPQQH